MMVVPSTSLIRFVSYTLVAIQPLYQKKTAHE
jgi:hypothetical protein